MKRILLTAAIAIGTLTAMNAQETETKTGTMAMNKTELKAPVTVQDNYSAVKMDKIPQAIKDALATDFKEATLTKAYANEDGKYKLVLMTAEKAKKTVYANSEGEWLKPE